MTPVPPKGLVKGHFALRVASHPFTVWQQARPQLGPSPAQPANPQVIAVRELLVAQRALTPFQNQKPQDLMNSWFPGQNVHVLSRTSVFGGALGAGHDVEVWRVSSPPTLDVFDMVRHLRLTIHPFYSDPRAVSPNHVLVPCPWDDFCPHGPPFPKPQPPPPLQPTNGDGLVTVIDSSYMWGRHGHTPWGNNPLADVNGATFSEVTFADWLDNGHWRTPRPQKAPISNATVEAPDEWKAGVLDRIAGHANFVAGIVAARCPNATIDIWSHNGGFDSSNAQFPTEASVTRSLWQSQQSMSDGVIQIGFAFEPYQGIPSTLWDNAFAQLGHDDVIVAPAGNEGDTTARYPAAFFNPPSPTITPFTNLTIKKPSQPVVGVASVSSNGMASGNPVWTNSGSWVACSAVGENVRSTFLDWNGPIEDEASGQSTNFTGWAEWNGTSFASPRVTAAIVNFAMTLGVTPAAALDQLFTAHAGDLDDPVLVKMIRGRHTSRTLGTVLPHLP